MIRSGSGRRLVIVKLASQMMKESRHSATLAGSSFDCISSSPRSLGNSVRNSKTACDALSMKNICNKLGPENNMTLKILFVLFSLFNFLYLSQSDQSTKQFSSHHPKKYFCYIYFNFTCTMFSKDTTQKKHANVKETITQRTTKT